MTSDEPTPLIDHLVRSGLSRGEATRIVSDVLAYYSEGADEFIRRRHRELQRSGVPNTESFALISRELSQRRVVAPELSERQIRRVIYG